MKNKKLPTVYEKHIIVIDGVEHLVKGMQWDESISQAIGDNIIENTPEAIIEYIIDNNQ